MRSAGELIVRHSKLIFFGFVGLIALSTIWGFGVFSNLKGGGYDNPNSDSALVSEILAIFLDATVVRALLVPALMRLMGLLNWWSPKWMEKLHQKAGLSH